MNKKMVIGIIIAGIFVMLAFVPAVEYNGSMGVNASNHENSDVSALPLKSSNNVYKFTFHGNKVLVKMEGNGYFASYNINGKITNISVVYLGNSIQYSINDGAWKHFEMPSKVIKSKGEKTTGSANPMLMPESSYNYHFWWDCVYYDGGHAHAYDHPSLSFYNLRAKDNYRIQGSELCHFMIGSATVEDSVAIGILIGIVIGALVGGPVGVVVGAVIGTIVGLSAINFKDNANDIWFSVSLSFIYALHHIPWWDYLNQNSMMLYIASNLNYLRIGGNTYINALGSYYNSPH